MAGQKVRAYGAQSLNESLRDMIIERRAVGEKDVQMEILYCGICHSDLHQLHNDFGHTRWPLVPGHEIVGRVTAVGSGVAAFKAGDLAAIGCIVDSCGHCESCAHDTEQFCEEGVTFSFNSADKEREGEQTYGGFSKYYVCNEKYVLHMPAFADLAAAAPLLCAGITVYSPLKHWQAGPGKRVAILGIGGLGHIAIKIAKALGANVTVLTTSPSKIEDARRLGADEAIMTTDAAQMQQAARSFDMILDTVSAKHDVNQYLQLLRWNGALVLVGLPNEPLEVGAFNVVHGNRALAGSNIGGIAQTQEMLDFCFKHNITADIESIAIQQVNEAFERLAKNDVKYRFVVDMASLAA